MFNLFFKILLKFCNWYFNNTISLKNDILNKNIFILNNVEVLKYHELLGRLSTYVDSIDNYNYQTDRTILFNCLFLIKTIKIEIIKNKDNLEQIKKLEEDLNFVLIILNKIYNNLNDGRN